MSSLYDHDRPSIYDALDRQACMCHDANPVETAMFRAISSVLNLIKEQPETGTGNILNAIDYHLKVIDD